MPRHDRFDPTFYTGVPFEGAIGRWVLRENFVSSRSGRPKGFGIFVCSSCSRHWTSAHAYRDKFGQDCQGCGAKTFPHIMWQFLSTAPKHRGENLVGPPHDASRCDACKAGCFCTTSRNISSPIPPLQITPSLASNWEALIDPATLNTYYWNTATNVTTWERPTVDDPTSITPNRAVTQTSVSSITSSTQSQGLPTPSDIAGGGSTIPSSTQPPTPSDIAGGGSTIPSSTQPPTPSDIAGGGSTIPSSTQPPTPSDIAGGGSTIPSSTQPPTPSDIAGGERIGTTIIQPSSSQTSHREIYPTYEAPPCSCVIH
jgi:hypothetical protein